MRVVPWWRRIFKKRIPRNIEKGCQRLVMALISKESRIEEIRLFGSYANGVWVSESDIDIGVFISASEYFYEKKDITHLSDHAIWHIIITESPAVTALRNVNNGIFFPGKECDLHIFSSDTFSWYTAKQARKGRVLYRSFSVLPR